MSQKRLWLFLFGVIITTLWGNATELTRNGWNLISVCQDMNRSEVDMSGIEEIQSQDGKSIYTGDWAEFSNLNLLSAGYAYWVKGSMGISFNSGKSIEKLEKPLLRDGWNLMGVCKDIPVTDINMSFYEEIQSQDGETQYTGVWATSSNLEILKNGYGYWVKGTAGTLFSSKNGLSIPSGFDYSVINNAGTIVSSTYQNYTIKLFADLDVAANAQLNHTGIVVRINGINTPVMQIQESYQGQEIVAAIYDSDNNLVGISEMTLVATSEVGTFIDIMMEDDGDDSDDNSTDDNSTNPIVTADSVYHQVLGLSLKFYEAQRDVGPFPTVDWRKPASINDGADVGVDLNGGWFDAGDHVKFNLPMSYSVGMLNWSMIEGQEAYIQAGKLVYGKDQVKYALDYLLNTYDAGADLNSPADDKVYFQVADGHADHSFWGAPENLTMNRPTFTCDSNGGCAAVAGTMVGAFASGAILFADDTAYATKLLNAAKRLYTFGITYPTDLDYSSVGQDFYALYENTHNEDQLAWGAMWLYRTTQDSTYLTKAKSLMSNQYPWGHSWDNMTLGVELMLVQEGQSDYKQRVENELNAWINLSDGISKSAGGLRVRSGIKWGNLRYASTVAYLSLMYSELVSDAAQKQRFVDFGKSQIDYILGDNPNQFSYVVGYGENSPLRPHHRAASGVTDINDPNPNKYVIEGALVGGPMSANDNDYQDVRAGEVGWTANEVTTDYNAGFTGALAKLALLYGEEITPKTDAEIVALDSSTLTFNTIRNQNSVETAIISNLNLIATGMYGSNISWQSSNSSYISNTGVVTVPAADQGDQRVTLTATITKGVASDTKIFVLTVLAEQSESESVALAKAALTFDTIKNQNSSADNVLTALTLPTQGSYGTTISWSSDNSNVISNTGVVTRQATDSTVTLTAIIVKGESRDVKTFLLIVPAAQQQVDGACQVKYFVRDEWNTGATIDVTVTNQIADLYGWEVTFSFPSGQTLSGDLWNGVETQSGNFVKVLNESYNAQSNKGANIEFGFVLNHNGVNGIPNDFRLNGQLCDGQTGGMAKPTKPILTGKLVNNNRADLT